MSDAADFAARRDATVQRRRPGRVLAVDVARALAIVGMVSVNVGPTESAEPGAWLYQLPHGRASILFVLLAGIGVSLMSRRLREADRPQGLRPFWAGMGWRSALLLVGGLALQRMGHESNVILAVYALLFVVGGLLVRARDGLVLAVAVLGVLAGPVLWLAPQVGSGVAFDGRPPELGDPPLEVLTSLVLTGPYPLVTWLAPFALGMWLGRRDLTDVTFQRRAALVAGVLAVAAPLLAHAANRLRGGLVGDISWGLLLTDAPHGQMPLWLVGSSAVSVLVLVGCLVLERRLPRRLLVPAAFLGQLSLTFYVLHLVVLAALRPLPHTLLQGVVISIAMVVAAALGAALWRRGHRRGPLELLVRAPWTWRARPA